MCIWYIFFYWIIKYIYINFTYIYIYIYIFTSIKFCPLKFFTSILSLMFAHGQALNCPTFINKAEDDLGQTQSEINVRILKTNYQSLISILNFCLSPFPFTLIIKTLLWYESGIIILKWLHFGVLTQTFLFFCFTETCQVYLPFYCLQPLSWTKAERIKAPGFCVFCVFMCWMVVNHTNDSRNFLLEGLSSLTAYCSHHGSFYYWHSGET